ncbi:Fructosamine kinase [Rhizoctonia solani]|uniref:protein-ribulosamine 3-kinase n=1 Tax=Rhizoctonia solani TaxID=456999 RepID=A0A8H7M5N9_9AGAM|nr:Fructosamine kinase [Rhizoctonia solani]
MSSTFLIEKLKISFPGETFIARGGPRISSSNDQTYYGKSGTPSEVEQYRRNTKPAAYVSCCAGLMPNLASSAGASTILARRLASELHGAKSNNGKFGFECPTFCGATKIDNGWYSTWADAYNAMIGGLLDKLEKQESYKKLCRTGREVQQRVIPHYLGDRLKGVEPVLCHGDLWSGNVGVDSEGNPAIFDPSSYYGHNESDLAIGRMFGGFSAVFYEQYHLIRPKSEPLEEYDQRVKLYKLFHYLNHTVLFGSGYANQAMNLATQLLKSLPL